MLDILICEDDPRQREQIQATITHYLKKHHLDMSLVLSTGCPTDVLDHLKRYPDTNGFYFLDVDLQHEINGIDLATRIKEQDSHAKIVFITTHDELSHLVFKYKIEAMDYIIKGNKELKTRVGECLEVAHTRYINQMTTLDECYSFESAGQVWNIPYSEILFFETDLSTRHRIILHMKESQIAFRGFIKQIAKVNPSFFQCHKSVVVNTENIKQVHKASRTIEMINGEIVSVSSRKIAILIARIKP
ncbi:MAG: LytTR family DNA-binding domain-containing protein [Lachnospiraceae bacterium]|nr:LytTR family DNA-binding domain-containing protein [Lachnospiraceae bacterium]